MTQHLQLEVLASVNKTNQFQLL